jgi:hypothetical protein
MGRYFFAVVVDGEVAMNLHFTDDIGPQAKMLNAIYSSNPTIIKTNEMIEKGSTWDGTSFTPPQPSE